MDNRIALMRRVLLVYQNSKARRWTLVATSRSRHYLHVRSHRMNTRDRASWSRFGEWETTTRTFVGVGPRPHPEAKHGTVYGLFVRYPQAAEFPRVDVERAFVREIRRTGFIVHPTITPAERQRWRELQRLRAREEFLGRAGKNGPG